MNDAQRIDQLGQALTIIQGVRDDIKAEVAALVTSKPLGATGDWVQRLFDDFNTIDPALWRRGFFWKPQGGHRGANWDAASEAKSEAQWYDPAQVLQGNSMVRLKAERRATDMRQVKDLGRVFQYVSGLITTCPDPWGQLKGDGKAVPASFSYLYGWKEARVRMSPGKGLWSGVWDLAVDCVWPPENDQLEILGADMRQAHMTTHYATGDKSQGFSSNVVDWTDWHVIGCDWRKDGQDWYIDGKKVATQSDPAKIPQEPMYLLFNLAVGNSGSWGGAPDNTTQFPAYFDIDWVRVWQRPT